MVLSTLRPGLQTCHLTIPCAQEARHPFRRLSRDPAEIIKYRALKIIAVPPALTTPNLLILKRQYFSNGFAEHGTSTLYLTGLRMRRSDHVQSRAAIQVRV
jgi:hypothetical protein